MEDSTNIPAEVEDDEDFVSPIAQVLSECRKVKMDADASLADVRQALVNAGMSAGMGARLKLDKPHFLAFQVGNCLFTLSELKRVTIQMWEVKRARASNQAMNTWNGLGESMLEAHQIRGFEPLNVSYLGGQNAPPDVNEYDTSPVTYWQKWEQSLLPTQANTAAIGTMVSALVKKQYPQWGEIFTPEVAADFVTAQRSQEADKPMENRKAEHVAQIEAQREIERHAKQFTFKQYADEIWNLFRVALPIWAQIPDEGHDRQIVRLMLDGKTDDEIADMAKTDDGKLVLTSKQVSSRLSELRKLYGIPKRQ